MSAASWDLMFAASWDILQIVLLCDWVDLICDDTYLRRDKWGTYPRRDKCGWAYNPTSHVESTWVHVKGVDPWRHTLWELILVFLEGVASRSPHGSAMCDKIYLDHTPMWIKMIWFVRTLIREVISAFAIIAQRPMWRAHEDMSRELNLDIIHYGSWP